MEKGEELKTALIKKALGYDATETVEEYVEQEGEIKLSKKKITKKNVPPDITAIKMLLDGSQDDLTKATDEELEKEKRRLLRLLKQKEREKK